MKIKIPKEKKKKKKKTIYQQDELSYDKAEP